jgi:hypothetical protein
MVDEVGEYVFINNFLWDQFDVDTHLFRLFQGSVEVECFDGCCHESGRWFGYNAVG